MRPSPGQPPAHSKSYRKIHLRCMHLSESGASCILDVGCAKGWGSEDCGAAAASVHGTSRIVGFMGSDTDSALGVKAFEAAELVEACVHCDSVCVVRIRGKFEHRWNVVVFLSTAAFRVPTCACVAAHSRRFACTSRAFAKCVAPGTPRCWRSRCPRSVCSIAA